MIELVWMPESPHPGDQLLRQRHVLRILSGAVRTNPNWDIPLGPGRLAPSFCGIGRTAARVQSSKKGRGMHDPSGSPLGTISGIVELEVNQVTIRPDYSLNAVAVEIVNPAGDGVRLLLDLGAALDLALRIGIACARLRGIAGATP
jgi:hypothetical protein